MTTQAPKNSNSRRAGILLPVFSLPGKGGVGTMGKEARAFVDFLADSGQSVWQVLPLTPPAICNSPYSAHSVFAGNPLLISLEELEEEGLIPRGSTEETAWEHPDRVNYSAYRKTLALLRQAFYADFPWRGAEIAAFRQEHAFWLEDYALYMAIHTKQGDISHLDWPATLLLRIPHALESARRQLREQMDFWIYVQYLFFRQWTSLRAYANGRGIEILGDMPIYTAQGSADAWSHPEIFQMDKNRRPHHVAGVPPDAFSESGQRWGNPLYDWEYLKTTGYRWWIERLKVSAILYDSVRIDHFRALDEYYAIPAENKDAREGEWLPGPGMDFIRTVQKELPGLKLIAEDLGLMTDSVRALLRDSGLPGMSVLLFAFDPSGKSDYLPHNIPEDKVAYIGTHDNDTAQGWIDDAPESETAYAVEYLGLNYEEEYRWGWLRSLYATRAHTAIAQMQDILDLDNSARMNTPATVEDNWQWRMLPEQLTGELAERLRHMMFLYGRLPEWEGPAL